MPYPPPTGMRWQDSVIIFIKVLHKSIKICLWGYKQAKEQKSGSILGIGTNIATYCLEIYYLSCGLANNNEKSNLLTFD